MERQTIRQLRRAAGMAQRELAERMGVSAMSVSHWEKRATNHQPGS